MPANCPNCTEERRAGENEQGKYEICTSHNCIAYAVPIYTGGAAPTPNDHCRKCGASTQGEGLCKKCKPKAEYVCKACGGVNKVRTEDDKKWHVCLTSGCKDRGKTYYILPAETAFQKFDEAKLRYELIPPSTLKALADVLTYGANKYEAENWRKCEDLSRYIGAAMRHFEDHRAGNIFDNGPDGSGKPHLWLAMTNLMFLIELTPEIKQYLGSKTEM